MEYQPKVNNIQQYSDNQGKHIVHKGKLVSIVSDIDTVKELMEKKLGDWTDWIDNFLYLLPIIISETEEIYDGDMAFGGLADENEIREIKNTYGGKRPIKAGNFHLYKVLALPEHFSDKHLQAIVDGKMKDGDEVLVKCRHRSIKTGRDLIGHTPVGEPTYIGNYDVWNEVHLNQQNHITLFPAKQSLNDFARNYDYPIYEMVDDPEEAKIDLIKAGAKWAKENNY